MVTDVLRMPPPPSILPLAAILIATGHPHCHVSGHGHPSNGRPAHRPIVHRTSSTTRSREIPRCALTPTSRPPHAHLARPPRTPTSHAYLTCPHRTPTPHAYLTCRTSETCTVCAPSQPARASTRQLLSVAKSLLTTTCGDITTSTRTSTGRAAMTSQRRCPHPFCIWRRIGRTLLAHAPTQFH